MEKSQTKPRSRQRDKLPRILVVDANAGYRSVISHVVELAGGEFESVAEFDAARRQIERPRKFDLVILGMSADSRVSPKQLGELRAAAGSPPFILLDESSDEAGETLETYEAGASQVMTKPFVPDALIGAIKAELRGPDLASVVAIATKIELEGLVFDAKQRTVKSADATVSLTKREWQLLSFFLTNPNQFFSAEEVVLPAWGPDASIEQFRTYVTRLRQKLLPYKGVCEVVNEKGRGYRLQLQQPKLPPN
jgi:DNA-binding response OmpR family regulator